MDSNVKLSRRVQPLMDDIRENLSIDEMFEFTRDMVKNDKFEDLTEKSKSHILQAEKQNS